MKNHWQILPVIEYSASHILPKGADLKEFLQTFASNDSWGRIFDECTRNGWAYDETSGEWSKNRIKLLSQEGFELDRAIHMRVKTFSLLRPLAVGITNENWPIIERAYLAGLFTGERIAYKNREENTGRNSTKPLLDRVFSKALSDWKQSGNLGKPKFKDIKNYIVWTTDKIKQPTYRTLQNHFTKWTQKKSRK
jgi:hypothetical protein